MSKLDDKQLQRAISWKPFREQEKIIKTLDGKIRDIRLSAGRRWGKSMLCAYLMLREALYEKRHIALIAPTYDLADRVFAHLLDFINSGYPDLSKYASSRIPQKLETPWGSWIRCKSADSPEGILGEEYDLVILDEAARVGKRTWEQYISPGLTSRKGKSVMISTPHGQDFFYNEYMRCKDSKEGKSFHFSSLDSPYFSKDEWERQKKLIPNDVFMQEYEASFLPDAAAVFKNVDDLIYQDCLQDVIPGHYYIMGVDLGKYEDYTVITVIDKTSVNGAYRVVYQDRFQGRYPYQKDKITAIARRYNNARIIVDSTGVGEPIKDDFERDRGLFVDDFKFSGKSKEALIDKLRIMIEQKFVVIPPIETLIDELKAFGYQLTNPKTGKPYANIRYSAPQGLHDDCVDSLALAVWGLSAPEQNDKTPLQKELQKAVKPKRESYF